MILERKYFKQPQQEILREWEEFMECVMGKRFVRKLTNECAKPFLHRELITDRELFRISMIQHFPILVFWDMIIKDHGAKIYKYILLGEHLYEFNKWDASAYHAYYKLSDSEVDKPLKQK